MGIIQKQSIKGTIYSYLGVGIGFITTGYFFPNQFSTGQIGLLQLLVSFSLLFSQFASLGINNVTTRLFSYFRDSKTNHNGYLLIAVVTGLIGFLLSLIVFFAIKSKLIENNVEKSELFVQYVSYLIPLIFVTLFFNILDAYNKVLFDATLGIFLKEFIQRFLILLSIGLFIFNILDFSLFVLCYIFAFSFPTFYLVVYLVKQKQFSLHPSFIVINKTLKKSMISVGFFGILASFGMVAALNIDKIIIFDLLDISQTGIYSIAFFYGTLISIPSRALLKISSAVIAEGWKNKDTSLIKTVYYKSCTNQFIIGLLVFIGLWANIDNVFKLIPRDFESGKYVILFIGLSQLLMMLAGVSSNVISTSKFYRWQTYFIALFCILIIVANYLLIPIWGITGAAIACLIANFIFHFIRYLFLYIKFRFQPYSIKFLFIILIGIISYFVSEFIPSIENFIIDIIIRSGIIILIFIPSIYYSKISLEINKSINNTIAFFLRKN